MKRDIFEDKKISEIHIIPYSHHDFSWTNTRQWHISRYIHSFLEVLNIMKDNRDFTWQIDDVLHSLTAFRKYCPDRFEEFRMRVSEGRINIANGGMSLIMPTHVGEETFIRNMTEGKQYFENTFGIGTINVFFNADTTCGYSQLPQLLSLSGHDYYKFFRPEEALDGKKVPKQFVWKGLDGSSVIVSRCVYTGFMDGKYTNLDFDTHWDEIREQFYSKELEEKLHLLPTGIVCVFDGGDDVRPLMNISDESINIIGFIAEWNKREKTKMKFSSLEEYFDRLKSQDIPIYEGVLDQCELSFYAPFKGKDSLWRNICKLDHLIVKAETLSAFSGLLGGACHSKETASMWNELFELTGHAMEYALEKDTNDMIAAGIALESRLQFFIKHICDEMAMAVRCEEGEQYVLFNILNWNRKEAVGMHITGPYGVRGFDLFDGNNNKIDYQIVDIYDGDKKYAGYEHNSVDIVANVEIPALGYTTLRVVRNGTSIDNKVKTDLISSGNPVIYNTLDTRCNNRDIPVIVNNGSIEVTFEKGHIRKVRDLRTGMPVISAENSSAFNRLRFVHTKESNGFLPTWEEIAESEFIPETWGMAENGPIRWIYRVMGRIGGNRVKLDMIIIKDRCAVEFDVDMQCNGGEGYFAAGFASDSEPGITAGIPFGVEERNLSQESYGRVEGSKFHHNSLERGVPGLYYAYGWTSFKCAGLPVSIISDNCSLFYLHDNVKNTISIIMHRIMPLAGKEDWFAKCHPSVEGKGEQQFRYFYYLQEKEGIYSDIVRLSKEIAQPVEAIQKFNYYSKLNADTCTSLVGTDRKNIIVSAFYPDKDCYILRLYETDGLETKVNISLSFDFKDAFLMDLLGNHIAGDCYSVDMQNRVITVESKPWQIINLRIR